MEWIYYRLINLAPFLLRIAALFGAKFRRLHEGHSSIFPYLELKVDRQSTYIWFHVASLGEFEQGRPVIETLRKNHPEKKILLTFFSPSGYEVQKEWKGADLVCYLPFDSCANVDRFFRTVRIESAIFVKYEFWGNYLNQLKQHQIPTYLICGIFRPDQLFFKRYGQFYLRWLNLFTHLFVQNEESCELLIKHGLTHVTAAGDTRFDRVVAISGQVSSDAKLSAFCKSDGQRIIMGGSTWDEDEKILFDYLSTHPDVKLVLAPHMIDEKHLARIERRAAEFGMVRYSQCTEVQAASARCLVIDCFGLLSSAYRYADLAFVGGGFGAGIHNTIEAAVYGIPVFFGPRYEKFREAVGLIDCGGAYSVESVDQFSAISDVISWQEIGQKAGNYVLQNAGTTEKLFACLFASK